MDENSPNYLSNLYERFDITAGPWHKPNFEWHETHPGQYERDIDEAEQFYTSAARDYELSGYTYFAITACTGISKPLKDIDSLEDFATNVEDAFRHSWTRLRYDHPTLAARMEYDVSRDHCTKIYNSPQTQEDVNSWLGETFKVINNGMTGLEFANIDPKVGRHATMYLITPPPTQKDTFRRDILFRSPHDIIDGMGTLHLLNNLLQYVSQALTSPLSLQPIPFGSEHENLAPPLRIAARIPSRHNQAQATKEYLTQCSTSTSKCHPNILSIPFNNSCTLPLQSQRLAMHLSSSETSALLRKCKVVNVSITQAVHTSIALAIRDLQPHGENEKRGRYLSYSLVNLRPVCSPPYNTLKHAAAVYHCISAGNLVVDMAIQAKGDVKFDDEERQEFKRVLKIVSDFYQDYTPDKDYISIVPSLFAAKTNPYESELHAVPSPNPTPSVSLSSLGIIDKIVQPSCDPFEVGAPWVMGAEYSTGWGVFMGTWRGRLGLSVGFNRAWHGREEVMVFLESVRGLLEKGLEVEEEDVDWE